MLLLADRVFGYSEQRLEEAWLLCANEFLASLRRGICNVWDRTVLYLSELAKRKGKLNTLKELINKFQNYRLRLGRAKNARPFERR